MPLNPAPIDAPTLTRYSDAVPRIDARDQPRYHLTADGGIVWPCPRCATTLRARAHESHVIHGCRDVIAKPSPGRKHARTRLVAAWWEAWHAALDMSVCTRDHVPANAHVVSPTFNGLVAVTSGDRPTTFLLPDAYTHGAHDLDLSLVARAVLIARLRAWADLLDAATATTPTPDQSTRFDQ